MSGMVYKWKPGARVKLDAQVVGEQLEAIRVRSGGELTARMVLEEARNEASPLHDGFEWDDEVAAEQWREGQARHMITTITVVPVADKAGAAPVRAFVSVVRDERRSFTSITHAMSDDELRRQVLAQAWEELRGWQDRYKEYQELAGIFTVIEAERPRMARAS